MQDPVRRLDPVLVALHNEPCAERRGQTNDLCSHIHIVVLSSLTEQEHVSQEFLRQGGPEPLVYIGCTLLFIHVAY